MHLHVSTLHHPGTDYTTVMLYEWRSLSKENRAPPAPIFSSAWCRHR
jgi:hypothetical protein